MTQSTVEAGATSIPQLRWHIKRVARRGVGMVGAVAVRRRSLRVLTYHRIEAHPRDPFSVPPAAFARQMAAVAASGRAVDLDRLLERLGAPDDDRSDGLLVTIDDLESSVVANGLPTLIEHGVPAVAFPIVSMIDQPGFVTSAQLREFADAGVEIGSHTMTHRRLARLEPSEARAELVDSRARLEDLLGRRVRALAYPFGTKAAIAAWLSDVVDDAGYEVAFTSLHGTVQTGADARFLPRVKVESGDSDRLFHRLIDGALDPWRLVDEGLGFLQRPQQGSEGLVETRGGR